MHLQNCNMQGKEFSEANSQNDLSSTVAPHFQVQLCSAPQRHGACLISADSVTGGDPIVCTEDQRIFHTETSQATAMQLAGHSSVGEEDAGATRCDRRKSSESLRKAGKGLNMAPLHLKKLSAAILKSSQFQCFSDFSFHIFHMFPVLLDKTEASPPEPDEGAAAEGEMAGGSYAARRMSCCAAGDKKTFFFITSRG